ncbi:MAG: glycosyltransferase family 9 protein [Candidatus Omnitrophota bacterium]|nr:glycosyltransferase family 9 protein [Candidatus Omnitrophota bacterium]
MEIDRNAEFINHLGGHLRTGSLTTKFWFTNSDQADCDKILQKNGLSRGNYICVFPGSGFRAKHWGTDNWLKFFEGFFCGYPLTKVVLLGGPRDKKVNDAIFARLRSRNQVIDLTGSLNLRVLAKVIAHSKLLVSTDTAAIHIAAAVGTPNVCIMGGGHFGRFYPYGDLSKNRIVHKQMDCYGCNWRCRYSSIKCIQDIDCEDVLKEVQKIL